MDEEAGRDTVRAVTSGCLASPVGFVLSGLVLIPLWLIYPFSTGDSSGFIPTFVSFFVGVAYSLAMGAIVGAGIPRRWWSLLGLVLIGCLVGSWLGLYMRSSMINGCLLGTGPQPDYCHIDPEGALVSVVLAYTAGGAFLGFFLSIGGALNLGRRMGALSTSKRARRRA